MVQSLAARVTGVLVVLLASTAVLGPASGETRFRGTIEGTVEWTKENSPYIIIGDVIVPKGATLKIGPGVTVRFKPDIATREGTNAFDLELLVEGTLITEGAEADTVFLTTDSSAPRWTDWQGIVIQGEGAHAELSATTVEFCNEAVKVMSGATLTARHSTFRRSHAHGIRVYKASVDLDNVLVTQVGNTGGTGIGINFLKGGYGEVRNSFIIGAQNGLSWSQAAEGKLENSVVTMCATRGVIVRHSAPTITGCTITQNDYGLVLSADAQPTVKENNIFDNHTANVTMAEYDDEMMEIDLTRNWWGNSALGIIEETIVDNLDDAGVKAIAKLDPVLEEAVTTGGSRPKQTDGP